jgi:hypothetical protein
VCHPGYFSSNGFPSCQACDLGMFQHEFTVHCCKNSDFVGLCLRTTWPCWCDAFANLLAGNKLHELLGRFVMEIIPYFWGAWVQQVHLNVGPLQGTSRAALPRSAASAVMTLGTSTKRRAGWDDARNARNSRCGTPTRAKGQRGRHASARKAEPLAPFQTPSWTPMYQRVPRSEPHLLPKASCAVWRCVSLAALLAS